MLVKHDTDKTIRKERHFLKELIKLSAQYPEGKIPKRVVQILKYDQKTIELLFDSGFIVMGYDPSLDKSDTVHQARNFFLVTDKGRMFGYWLAEDRRTIFFRNVLTPLVVSVITTLFTLWAKAQF